MTENLILPLLRDGLLGYLLGSLPFGLILTQFAGHGDLRHIGSGNIGATNVLRTGHKSLAVLTLLLDALKGTCAVYIVRSLEQPIGWEMLAGYLSGFGAFLGHLFPVWLKFKGGKGVATYIGVLIGMSWSATGVFCGSWLLSAYLTRISSLSALLASLVTPLFLFWRADFYESILFGLMTILLIWKHRANIQRLLAGEEPHISMSRTTHDTKARPN